MSGLRLDFRGRLLLGAVLPALLTVSLLEMVFLHRYRGDIERAFLDRSEAVAQQLGVAAEYALFSGSLETLDLLAAGVRQSAEDIVAVSVLNRDGGRIAGAGHGQSPALALVDRLQVVSDENQVTVQAPIHPSRLPLDGEDWEPNEYATEARGVIGYVLIEISRAEIVERHAQMLRITIMIMLAGLLLASWVSARIAADVMRKLEAARQELTQQKDMAETLARTDMLTGLANRRAFDEAAQLEIRRALRYGTPLALIMADIDCFKSINDSHGHHVGDQVLVSFSHTLQSSVRDVDLVGRWGGEEFVILMPGTDLDQAMLAAERMRLAVAATPTRCEGTTVSYTASFGAAVFAAATPTLDDLLGRTDSAMYRAKAGGRNRVELG